MNLQFFCCFHDYLIKRNYLNIESDERDKYITFYGVNKKIVDDHWKNIIYEYDLLHYNENLQKNLYNEGSCLYHVYKNKLYDKFDYVGFCQYDMYFMKDIFTKISNNIDTDTIFILDYFYPDVKHQLKVFTQHVNDFDNELHNYNTYFNTNYKIEDIIKCINKCNTFLIPKKTYEKMMSWLNKYFRDNIHVDMIDKNNNYKFNPGHVIEGLTGMFLAIERCEGMKHVRLRINHRLYK